jgi:4-amino-4-deoxy-L-arabinose transferase-like glycosyltransferase
MTVSRSSKPSPVSRAKGRAAAGPARGVVAPLAAFALLAIVSAAAVAFFYQRGNLLYYGDAVAHINIARRIVDSRTPGWEQIGTVWLPLPHLLMLPLVRVDELWRTGLAGSIPAAACFVLAGLFLFLAARRAFSSNAAGAAACALFALNPNLLYLQSIPMTETVFIASLAAILYFTVRFRDGGSLFWAAAAGLAVAAATLTRYEGWFLIPFVGLYLLIAAPRRRWLAAILFCAIASLGPALWLAHNAFYYSDPLEFYHGPYSAKAIYQRALDRGMARYPGDHDFPNAWLYFRTAAQLCAGWPLVWLGLAGVLASLWRRAFWPLLLLALPPFFYLLSVYSSGTPIFAPSLWPNSYYNTRYGTAALPLLAFAAAGLAAIAPARLRGLAATLLVLAAVSPWIAYPRAEGWVCWKESQVNSETRRAWTAETAAFLQTHLHPGDGVFTSFGDLTGAFQQAGVPLRSIFHEGNGLFWAAAAVRPDLFLWERWAVAISGDPVDAAILRAARGRSRYDCVSTLTIKGAPVIRIYRRIP